MGSAAQSRSKAGGSVGAPRGRIGVFDIALAAALLVVATTAVSKRRGRVMSFRTDAGEVQRTPLGDVRLSTTGLLFEVSGRAESGEEIGDLRSIHDVRGEVLDGASFRAVVDGRVVHMSADRFRPTPEGPALAAAHVRLETPDGALDGELSYALSRSPAGLLVSLALSGNVPAPHALSLSVVTPMGDRTVFVRGTGILTDAGDAHGPSLILEEPERACAITVPNGNGDLAIQLAPLAEDLPLLPLVVTATSPPVPVGAAARLFIAPTASLALATDAIARVRSEPFTRVTGRVLGGGTVGPDARPDPRQRSGDRRRGVDVWAVGVDGKPVLHFYPEQDGRFEVLAPRDAELLWYATTAHTRASPMVLRGPNDPSAVELTVLPGGEVHVSIRDVDTKELLTSRLIAHGVSPTADPNFGPDYRASGAGPLMDTLRGQADVPLPAGRYRLLATRGLEYTIDEKTIDVPPGSTQSVELSLRHVIATPGLVGCDFHVHARPSFDAPVLPEDRVLSLVAAGVDFAVPSEHNVVGHYGPALSALDLTRDLASVPGVEITTRDPRYGHFNVFPFPGPKAPPYKRTTLADIFAKAREGDPSRVLQVNHPRLAKDLGYFDLVGLDTKTGRTEHKAWRDDFDTLEVYNGADGGNRARVERVIEDWLDLLLLGYKYVATGDSDSHRIQYQWAGYPRTYVALPPEQAGDTGQPIDTTALVAALKAGHAFVTSGPFLDAQIAGAGVGGTVVTQESTVKLHVRVRAAPWIDVNEVEIRLGTGTLIKFPVASRSGKVGRPADDRAADERSAIRFERDVDVPVPDEGSFVVVIARGERALDEVLPHTPIQPLAFTNPIWLKHVESVGQQ